MYVLVQELCKPFPLFVWLTGGLLIVHWRRHPEQRRRLRPLLLAFA
jgi:hypothetical protein